jgi:HlyD family secretion protein
MTASEREAAKLDGERGNLVANIARAKGRITETEFQVIQIDQDLRSEVARELREIQAKSAEYVERKVAAEDLLKRIEIRAPQNGTVFQVAVHTVGGVINPAEPIMQIVPDSDADRRGQGERPGHRTAARRPDRAAAHRPSASARRRNWRARSA